METMETTKAEIEAEKIHAVRTAKANLLLDRLSKQGNKTTANTTEHTISHVKNNHFPLSFQELEIILEGMGEEPLSEFCLMTINHALSDVMNWKEEEGEIYPPRSNRAFFTPLSMEGAYLSVPEGYEPYITIHGDMIQASLLTSAGDGEGYIRIKGSLSEKTLTRAIYLAIMQQIRLGASKARKTKRLN